MHQKPHGDCSHVSYAFGLWRVFRLFDVLSALFYTLCQYYLYTTGFVERDKVNWRRIAFGGYDTLPTAAAGFMPNVTRWY
jgi:hypothetical protein